MNKLFYFSAVWCGPCKVFGPVMDQVALEVPVIKFDADDDRDTTDLYNVKAVPTVLLVDENGKELRRFTKGQSKKFVIDFYNQENI